MKFAVMSDIHDNIWALDEALKRVAGCDALFVLGDMCSPFVVIALGQGFAGPVHVVWGNNDGDRLLIVRQAANAGNITLHGQFAELNLGGRSIALTHYPHLGKALAAGQQYDLVCNGHNHQREITWRGRTLLVNPGEVMGRFGVHSVAIYDAERNEAELVAW